MKYVLDSNIAIKWVLPESDTPQALALRDAYQKQDHELIAPDIFPVEVGHALTKSERRGLLPQAESILRLTDVLNFSPLFYSYLPLLPRAMEISSQARIGLYDCLYVALAEQENCELVTADARLVTSLPGFPIRELSTL
jgi:predicted nucleic acid-binding protein